MSYMGKRQSEQVAFINNLAVKVFANPVLYGLTEDRAGDLKDLNITLQAKWTAATTPETRSKITIERKDLALKEIKPVVSNFVSIIRGQDLTADQLTVVGLAPRKTTRTKKPVPTTSPIVLTTVSRRNIFVELKADGTPRRGRPVDVAGALVLIARGPTPPESVDGWTFSTVTTDTKVTIPFESGPAETVWVTALWTNSRNETGPSASPVRVELPAGLAGITESGEDDVRLAA